MQLLASVCGNLYELSDHCGLKLLDLELPPAFGARYTGPQFGIEGTRELAGIQGRPIIGTIVKPSVGLTPNQTADLVRELGRRAWISSKTTNSSPMRPIRRLPSALKR